MKITDYKGYAIEFDYDSFRITGVDGYFDTMAKTRAKIDAIVAAESKEGFPIEVVSAEMKTGKLTSYNREENIVWFSRESGSRSKERVTSYSSNPQFFKTTPANLEVIRLYRENERRIAELEVERHRLEKSLTEPLSFPLEPKESK